MARIQIVTDSASDLPAELAAAQNVTVVALDVRLDGSAQNDLGNASAQEFWQHAGASSALATTAAPAPGAFQQAFTAAREAGCDGVCCITISSSLSATYQAASAGASEMGSDFPVRVIDSRFATMGEGLLVLQAAEQAATGADLDAVSEGVVHAIDKTFTLGTLDTLEYLRRGGRIGTAQAFLGSLLSIKPVIEVRDGVVEGESRQRTRSRSFRYLIDKVESFGPLQRFAVVHADADDIGDFLTLAKGVRSEHETIVTYVGPVIGAHTGPGTIGVCGIEA